MSLPASRVQPARFYHPSAAQQRRPAGSGDRFLSSGPATAITYCGVMLLFLPKFNLFAIDGFRAGLRIDDFVIAIVTVFLVYSGFAAPVIVTSVFRWAAGFVVASILSHVVGGGSVLFSIRMMEYLCMVVIGHAFGRLVKTESTLPKVLYWYLIINLVLCILQAAGLAGGIGISGFTSEFGGRAIGLCNGPWELGIVVCFLFGYLGDHPWIRESRNRRIFLPVACGIVLVLTAARTPLAIFFAIGFFRATDKLPTAAKFLCRFIAPILALAILYGITTFSKTDNFAVVRLREVLNGANIDELVNFAQNFSPSLSYTEVTFEDLSKYKDAGVDASMAMRLYIFSYLASNFYYGGPLIWLFGLGHGFSGNSTDMGMVRIFCEVGLLGFLCFHLMLWHSVRSVRPARLMVVALLINQLTLDVYVGYKTMFVFFLIVGYGLAMVRRNQDAGGRMIGPGSPSRRAS